MTRRDHKSDNDVITYIQAFRGRNIGPVPVLSDLPTPGNPASNECIHCSLFGRASGSSPHPCPQKRKPSGPCLISDKRYTFLALRSASPSGTFPITGPVGPVGAHYSYGEGLTIHMVRKRPLFLVESSLPHPGKGQ